MKVVNLSIPNDSFYGKNNNVGGGGRTVLLFRASDPFGDLFATNPPMRL